MAKDLKCPNCGAAGVAKEGGGLVCPACGGSFTFSEGEARLTATGEYDQLKETVESHAADLEELKQRLPASVPAEPPDQAREPGVDETDEEEDEDL